MTLVLLAAAPAGPAAAADEAASRSLTIGVDAYRQGSLEASVEALSEALRGALSSRQAAKAFYYRGLAYRALGRPTQAVADLEAAIAQRNGLSLGQLADAEDQRDAARRESSAPAGMAPPPATIASRPQEPSPIETQSHAPGFFTTTSIDPSEPAISAWAASTTAPPAPPAFATQVLPSAVQPPAAPPMRTAAIQPPSATPLPSAQAPAASGSILVQVARVQTKNEAYALVVRLISQHGAEFDPSMLKIVQGVAENKPPVYLVRLGPFATADEAQKRCSALRKTGYDCVVQY